jgi:hypothetical protein
MAGCPILAQSGHPKLHRTCPLSGVMRTWPFAVRMSAYDPKRTLFRHPRCAILSVGGANRAHLLVMSPKDEGGNDEKRFAMSAVVLLLSAGVSVQTATACSKEAVAGAVDRWTTVLAENNPDTIVALYSKDAVFGAPFHPRFDQTLPR